jgi:type IV pilus assembly protein PilP
MDKKLKHNHLLFFLAIIAVFSFKNSYALEEMADSNTKNVQGEIDAQEYVYSIEARTDPFRPFITPKAAQPAGLDPNEIIDEQKTLSGLQLLEPGQLTLVGILNNEGDAIALVEDQTKKGYILKHGVAIGKRGVVSQIAHQQVTVTETSRTRAGQEITNTLIMKLNKEGDK